MVQALVIAGQDMRAAAELTRPPAPEDSGNRLPGIQDGGPAGGRGHPDHSGEETNT
ncbi:hypothetical protein [Parafrankia sp. BMG5.11]|uniref:hypothetical protein n=1 Tax=Parafrankia sp. BMG5.11 TaxID=222540 RepID=UPI001A9EB3AB|nr:hypothetical protein [Parafrankia sp. BMG5.11]